MHATTVPLHSPPSSSAAPTVPVQARELGIALLGLFALGAAASLGGPSASAAMRLIPSVVLIELPALALTAPALIAVHQFLGLEARPEALAAALGRALVHAGRVAGGLAVVVMFFAATTSLAAGILAIAIAVVGVFTCATACVELATVERRALAGRDPAPGFSLLLIGWVGLGWLIALRVGFDVAEWVFGGGR